MTSLGKLGIGLTTVSTLLLLALMAELYYLIYHKKTKKKNKTPMEVQELAAAASTMSFLCFKPSAAVITSAVPINGERHVQIRRGGGDLGEEDVGDVNAEAELRRLHGLAGPPRLLFTIREETGEDAESDDGRKSDRRCLRDLFQNVGTPFLTPLSSPPILSSSPLHLAAAAMDSGCRFNPLFEAAASPPPKFKFLRDAEEKMLRKALMEAAARDGSDGHGGEEGSFIAIVINPDVHHHHHGSSPEEATPAASPSDTNN